MLEFLKNRGVVKRSDWPAALSLAVLHHKTGDHHSACAILDQIRSLTEADGWIAPPASRKS